MNHDEEPYKIALTKTLRTKCSIRCLCSSNFYLISGGDDGIIRLWNYQGEIIKELIGPKSSVRCLCISGQTLYAGSADFRIFIWSLESGKLETELLGHSGSINCLKIINWLLWSCGCDNKILIWNTGAKTILKTLQYHTDAIWALHFNPNMHEDLVFSASSDCKVALWQTNGEKQTVLQTLKNTYFPLYCIDEWKGEIICGGFGNVIHIWIKKPGWLFSSERWELVAQLKGHQQAVWCLMVDSHRDRLFSGSSDMTIRVWNLRTREEITVLEGHTDSNWTVDVERKCVVLFCGWND